MLAILDREGVDRFHVVGTSLGGYFAQYLVSRHPQRILKAVFGNTFPPNDLIKAKNGVIGRLIPYLPEGLVMKVLRGSFDNSIFPASGNDKKQKGDSAHDKERTQQGRQENQQQGHEGRPAFSRFSLEA